MQESNLSTREYELLLLATTFALEKARLRVPDRVDMESMKTYLSRMVDIGLAEDATRGKHGGT